MYSANNEQAIESMIQGWTRIDMLLALYERTIDTVRATQLAVNCDDETGFQLAMLQTQKMMLALHSGLKADEDEIAQNVARLLNFVMLRIEQQKFDEAIQFLEKLHQSFAQIRETAVDLETKGVIPPLSNANVVDTVA